MLATNLLNKTASSYLISTANHINAHLFDISRHNILSLIEIENDLDIDDCLYSLFSHQFYWPTNRKHSLRHSFIDKENEVVYFPGPFSLVPIPDENNLYIASPIVDESLGWNVFETIPSTEYLVSSYSWQNLISIPLAMRKYGDYINKHGKGRLHNLLSQNLDASDSSQKFEIAFFNNFVGKHKYQPHLDLENTPGKVRHEIVSSDEFLSIITDETQLDALLNDQNFHYLAYKKLGLCSISGSKPLQLRGQANIRSKTQRPKRVVHVIFCDSLDVNTLIENDLITKFPNIKKLVDQSINYSRFTSSGGWTYPCLYSLYSGIPPYWSFSLTPARVDPTCRLSSSGLRHLRGVKPNAAWHEVFYDYTDYQYNHKEDYLSRQLKANDVGQFALKQSSNHSWLYGLQQSIDFSIENYSNKNFKQVYGEIREKIDMLGKTENVLFVDFDALHQNIKPIVPRQSNLEGFTTSLSWIRKNISKEERLLGVVNDAQNELNKYFEKLSLIDHNLGILLKHSHDNDSIVLFSDNGSDVLAANSNIQQMNLQFNAEGSIVTFPKIMKPTLLVSDSSIMNDLTGKISKELVSTLDLYDIILKMSGVETSRSEYNEHLPVLPSTLGGTFNRKRCYSFSVTKARYSADLSSNVQNFELITRHDNESIDYQVSQPVLANKPPDSFSDPGSVLEFLFT